MKHNLIIISGPSGAGEDSIIDGLAEMMPIERVITTTTRQMRPGESEGRPYYFISKEEFQKGIDNNEFFEWAQEYNDNFYGVTEKELKRVMKSDKIGIWKVEYKGVIAAKKKIPGIKAVFINAPLKQIEARLRKRDNLSQDYIEERMQYTKEWLKHKDIYDYEINNEDGKLQESIQKLFNIIKNE